MLLCMYLSIYTHTHTFSEEYTLNVNVIILGDSMVRS